MSADDLHAECLRHDVERGADPNDLTAAQHVSLVAAVHTAAQGVTADPDDPDLVPAHAYKLLDAIEALPTPGERYPAVVHVLATLLLAHVEATFTP
jgi:hypothetical protein